MIHFRNDYSAGAHPAVLDALIRTNLELTAGYGCDPYCETAAEKIRTLCACPEAAVHFLVGGTQTNKTALAAFLRPYEAVIAAETGHICVHETGAIEATGHKVCTAYSVTDSRTCNVLVVRIVKGNKRSLIYRHVVVFVKLFSTTLTTLPTQEITASLKNRKAIKVITDSAIAVAAKAE